MIFKLFYPINYYTTADLIFLLFTNETFLYSQCCVTVHKSYKIFSQLSELLQSLELFSLSQYVRSFIYDFLKHGMIASGLLCYPRLACICRRDIFILYDSFILYYTKISYSKPEIKKDPARKILQDPAFQIY